jgi:hypothetical protein
MAMLEQTLHPLHSTLILLSHWSSPRIHGMIIMHGVGVWDIVERLVRVLIGRRRGMSVKGTKQVSESADHFARVRQLALALQLSRHLGKQAIEEAGVVE